MTDTLLKAELTKPLGLFFLMLLASVCNGMKQLQVVRQTGKPMTCLEYWSYVPETVTALAANVLAFVLLVLTDQLNYASAIAVGYGANSLADLLPRAKGGTRSFAMKNTPDDPNKVNKP